MFKAEILADSVYNGSRITTFSATFPRSILTEFYTHALDPVCIRKNLSSSRAIPTPVLVEQIRTNPFFPEFKMNKKGMQAGDSLTENDHLAAQEIWEELRAFVVEHVEQLHKLNVHKQYVNRPLEPWMFCTGVMTATGWPNFFAQRYHKAAEPSFQKIAKLMWEAMEKSVPVDCSTQLTKEAPFRYWHLPFASNKETWQDCLIYLGKAPDSQTLAESYNEVSEIIKKVSTARCARVSYLTHDGKRNIAEDLKLFEFLTTNNPGHWSPLEHVCTPARFKDMSWKPSQLELGYTREDSGFGGDAFMRARDGEVGYCGAYRGWKPFRHFFPTESITEFTPPEC